MELQSDSQFEEIEVPVIYLRPEERIYWVPCNSSSIPGQALVVDRTQEGEPVFLGFREGEGPGWRRIEDMGYVRLDKGLVQHPDLSGVEVSEDILVLCARKRVVVNE